MNKLQAMYDAESIIDSFIKALEEYHDNILAVAGDSFGYVNSDDLTTIVNYHFRELESIEESITRLEQRSGVEFVWIYKRR